MTDAERISLGLTKKLTYRYAFASGDFNFLEKHKNTNYLRALAHLGIYNDSGESFNEKYFTPDSIGQLKQKKDGDDTIKLEKPIYISDFTVPLEQIKRTIIPGGQLFDKDGNKLDPPLDLIKDEVMREAEKRITPIGVQLGLEGANQQPGGAGGTTGGTGETTTGQPGGVVVNADPEDEEAATNNDASSGGAAMSGGAAATSGGTAVSDSTSIREKLNRLLGYKIENGSVVVDAKGRKKMALDKPPLSISVGVEPKIEDDGSISVDGDVTINVDIKANKGINIIENGKLAIKFSNVTGKFICRSRKLTSLEGCPKKVGSTFDCGDNQITSLAGAPQEVGIFIADKNKSLTSLSGGPKIINGITDTAKSQNTVIYDVSNCGLTTLENNGITKFGPGGFNCSLNKLTNLNGLGIVASSGVVSFDCSKNELTSLNGIPRPIKDAKSGKPGSYWIRDNVGVTLFPITMADFEIDTFEAGGLSLTSLSFAPKKIYGSFNCVGNKGTTKLTNETLGKSRFKVGGGFEDDAGARIVAVDGQFVTSDGSWSEKTYGINTTYKAPPKIQDNTPKGGPGKSKPGETPTQYLKRVWKDAGPGMHVAKSLVISYNGILFIQKTEGKEPNIYDDNPGPNGKYPTRWEDFNGNPSIGIGHLIVNKKDINPAKPTSEMIKWQSYFKGGRSMTEMEMTELKVQDAWGIMNVIRNRFNPGVLIAQNQFDAIMSLGFNTGAYKKEKTCGGLGGPVGLAAAINAGDYKLAEEMIRTHSDCQGGKVKNGLIARRNREADIFANGYT